MKYYPIIPALLIIALCCGCEELGGSDNDGARTDTDTSSVSEQSSEDTITETTTTITVEQIVAEDGSVIYILTQPIGEKRAMTPEEYGQWLDAQ